MEGEDYNRKEQMTDISGTTVSQLLEEKSFDICFLKYSLILVKIKYPPEYFTHVVKQGKPSTKHSVSQGKKKFHRPMLY